MTNLRLPAFAAAATGDDAAAAAGLLAGGGPAGSAGSRLVSSARCERSCSPRPVVASPSDVPGSGRITRAVWSLAAAMTGLPITVPQPDHAPPGTGPSL